MKAELNTLMAKGRLRRAAGLACNPRREGAEAVDWLTEDEIQRAHCLTMKISLAETLAVRAAAGVAA